MSICLCGASAEKILDLIALKRLEMLGRASRAAFENCRAGRREVASLLEPLPDLEPPVNVLVCDRRLRVSNSLSKACLWSGPVPDSSLILVVPGVYAASPELNALLEMRGLTRMARALVVMGYCSIFAIDVSTKDGFVRRPQLTSVKRLRSYSEQMGLPPQTDGLIDALSFSLEHARSPLEARLALALTAPARFGGLGFERPKLNSPIELADEARAIQGVASIDGDLVWHDRRVVIEANGKLRHEGRFGEDLTRAAALESEGFSVKFATSHQLRSARQMLVLARWLEEHLGSSHELPSRRQLQEILNEINGFRYHSFSLGDSLPHSEA